MENFMKKLFLLLTLLCVGQIYGMEPLYPKQQPKTLTKQEKKELVEFYKSMLPELKQEILGQTLKSSISLDEAIDRIKTFSALHKAYNFMSFLITSKISLRLYIC